LVGEALPTPIIPDDRVNRCNTYIFPQTLELVAVMFETMDESTLANIVKESPMRADAVLAIFAPDIEDADVVRLIRLVAALVRMFVPSDGKGTKKKIGGG
jgi:hypothetical protein